MSNSGEILKADGNGLHIGMRCVAITQREPRKLRVADAVRIAACWNACAGIPTEKLDGKTLEEYVTAEAYVTGIQDGRLGLKGLGPQMLASSMAGLLVGSDAVNYLEMSFVHAEAGEIVITIQKNSGKTPHMLRREAEQQRDELIAAGKAMLHIFDRGLPDSSIGRNVCDEMKVAIAKVEAAK